MKVKDILKGRTVWLPSNNYGKCKPEISVLLPTWKRAENGLFEAAVKSVLSQSFSNLELIIVDDFSTDGTFDIIKRIMNNDDRVSCIRHTVNIGLPAISEFEAYEKSQGKYLAFMFDDNEWEFDALENLYNYAEVNNIKAVAGKYKLFVGKPGDSFEEELKWQTIGGSSVCLSNLLLSNQFAHGSVLLNRSVLETVGFYDPNIATSRFWDWDLWTRISKHFEFKMIDIMIGKEKGCGLEDSLGNTHQLYQWAVQERIHQPKDDELKLNTYRECDIFDVTFESSPFFYQSNLWLSEQYESKEWFDNFDSGLVSIRNKSNKRWSGKKIVYLNGSSTVNASSSINWGRLPYDKEYVIYYSSINYMDFSNWIFADAIIIERDLSERVTENILKWAKSMGIESYYYVDDNFISLAKEYENTVYKDNMAILAKGTSKENFEKFTGIFTSTEDLRTYFLEENFHENISVMAPILDLNQVQEYHPISKPINMCFFGSNIRAEILVNTIFSAIEKISKDYSINFYCPEDVFFDFLKIFKSKKHEVCKNMIIFNENLRIYSFTRSLDLDLQLKRLASKKIQIQIHCGPIIENNRYKTINALINAVSMGATLIATDEAPYSKIINDKEVCVLSKNTSEDWEASIRKMIDKNYHKEIYCNALEYCKKIYSELSAKDSLKAQFNYIKTNGMEDLNRRMIAHIRYLNSILSGMQSSMLINYGNFSDSNNSNEKVNMISSILLLSSLSSRKLSRVIDKTISSSKNSNVWPYNLLPLSISKAIVFGDYLESRIPNKNIKIILFSTGNTNIMLEFASNDQILEQKHININGICELLVEVPKIDSIIRLRIANNTMNTNVHILQRTFLSRSIFDIRSAGREG